MTSTLLLGGGVFGGVVDSLLIVDVRDRVEGVFEAHRWARLAGEVLGILNTRYYWVFYLLNRGGWVCIKLVV
jgi:hypothetical protein